MDEHVPGVENSEVNLFKSKELPATPSPVAVGGETTTSTLFSWTTAEFIEHKKTTAWYGTLAVITLFIAVAVWFFARDVFLLIFLILGVITFGIYAGRKPKQQHYLIDGEGVKIGTRRYLYADFGSFSIIPEDEMIGIEFLPLKRFATYMTIYANSTDQEKIVQILSQHLPATLPRNDLTDRLLRRIQF